MPQIWMTYEELGALLHCDRAAARAYAVASGLDRRRSRDGQTRAKLDAWLKQAFFDVILRERLEREIRICAGDLRALRARMARLSPSDLAFGAAVND